MPRITFAAPLIRAAIAALKAELPERIADFNANEANTVTLQEPVAYHFGAADPLVELPAVEVAAITGQGGDFDLDGPERHPSFSHNPTLTVVLWHEGERGELEPTYEMSLGLGQCAIEVLTRIGVFGDLVSVANDEGALTWNADVIPSDLTDDGRAFRKWRCPFLITLRLETVEAFGE